MPLRDRVAQLEAQQQVRSDCQAPSPSKKRHRTTSASPSAKRRKDSIANISATRAFVQWDDMPERSVYTWKRGRGGYCWVGGVEGGIRANADWLPIEVRFNEEKQVFEGQASVGRYRLEVKDWVMIDMMCRGKVQHLCGGRHYMADDSYGVASRASDTSDRRLIQQGMQARPVQGLVDPESWPVFWWPETWPETWPSRLWPKPLRKTGWFTLSPGDISAARKFRKRSNMGRQVPSMRRVEVGLRARPVVKRSTFEARSARSLALAMFGLDEGHEQTVTNRKHKISCRRSNGNMQGSNGNALKTNGIVQIEPSAILPSCMAT
ncbi:hypothetical protein B0T11DRAFT_318956 [Plectosphaerella cucumerina]|uniref:Uncharacterized protein n=1 Tax=Plectosphaerella cucumerina TaxID=40658 RepID=A0A8K0TFK5_9PEZI|nr:hypothetical protein B0T11DRAFT_318956 [Plectosphaerella cucumerina]